MIIARRDRTLASYPRTTDIGGHTSWRHKHQMGSTPLRMVMGFVGRGSAVVALALRTRRRLANDEAIVSSAPKPTAQVIARRVRAPVPGQRVVLGEIGATCLNYFTSLVVMRFGSTTHVPPRPHTDPNSPTGVYLTYWTCISFLPIVKLLFAHLPRGPLS